ncbi:MAG TPA: hypothetical protein DIS84_02335 [Corynebacterium stationis]|nr:hypothetical protein [Corynebacterium stationis]
MDLSQIHVNVVVFHDVYQQILTVRKRGTKKFMLPGDKPETEETAVNTAACEVYEETDIPSKAAYFERSI